MNKRKAVLSFLLFMSILLSACASASPTAQEEPESADRYGYSISFNALPGGMARSTAQYVDSDVLYIGGMSADNKPVLGKYYESVFTEYPVPETISYIDCCCKTNDGIAVLAGDYPAAWNDSADNTHINEQSSYSLFLLLYDNDARLISQLDLGEPFDQGIDFLSIRYFKGNYYLLSSSDYFQLNEKGEILNSLHGDGSSFISQACTADDLFLCFFHSRSDGGNDTISVQKLCPSGAFSFEPYVDNLDFTTCGIGYSADQNLILNTDRSLQYCEGDSQHELFSFSSAAVSNIFYSEIFPYQEGYLLVRPNQKELLSVQYGKIPDKTELVMWSNGQDPVLNDLVDSFNRSNAEYFVKMEPFDIDKDVVKAKIISGNGPDLYAFWSQGFSGLAEASVFENLLPYWEQSRFYEEGLISPVISAVLHDDCLYTLPIEFTIWTMLQRTGLFSDEVSSIEEAMKLPEVCSGEVSVFSQELPRDDIWHWLSNMYLGECLDTEAGTCSFNTPEYIALLDICSAMDEEGGGSGKPSIYKLEQVPGMLRMLYFNQAYGETYTLVSGLGSAFELNHSFSISNSSQNKDGAWEFIEHAIGASILDSPGACLPASSESFQALMNRSKDPGVWDMEFNEYLSVSDYDIEQLQNVIQNTSVILNEYPELLRIMSEEAAKVFCGDRSAKEAAEITQSRASLFIAERYG